MTTLQRLCTYNATISHNKVKSHGWQQRLRWRMKQKNTNCRYSLLLLPLPPLPSPTLPCRPQSLLSYSNVALDVLSPPLPLSNVCSRRWELSSATVIIIIINFNVQTLCREMHSAVRSLLPWPSPQLLPWPSPWQFLQVWPWPLPQPAPQPLPRPLLPLLLPLSG